MRKSKVQRSKFLEKVAERFCVEPSDLQNPLTHAIKTGCVDEPEKRGGWLDFSDGHAEQFERYLTERSRVMLEVAR